ncbi:lipoate--protein ligase [Pseudoflavonifractor sp. MSJ-37]|uniref:lipoate--protein ligase n=1 Tax=Pseudoflavonifractor sp. MSJ-37 TaxID=2841531 RepID=UPI001C0FF7ED|nr:lipoate--protein ligase [Pseudoflavonifractor sp. MSJ-37]MBU5434267.1 lipoate--protein ligase [Pseudoflavonifractor sp. MSJ-37]
MIYIETGSTDVYHNFALEYYFTVEKRLPDTVFLFWRTTPTLMIGKYQNVLEEIDKPYADAHGIHLVRRMSGGGTIYTDLGGWQFTFIQHKEAGEIEFSQYIAPVIDALREMGVDASFNGRNDLTIDGKKFSGNAQYRLGDCIVHHGSLLFDTDIEQMAASTTVDRYKIVSKSIKSVRDRVTNISEHLPTPMDDEAFKDAMVRHIMAGSSDVYQVTPEDEARIQTIARERFQSWDQIFGKDPKFTIDRTSRFAGGKIQFKLDIQKGVIREAAVYGDFFSTVDADTICAALIGCPYERSSVLTSLRANGIDGAVYRISAEEMAAAVVD